MDKGQRLKLLALDAQLAGGEPSESQGVLDELALQKEVLGRSSGVSDAELTRFMRQVGLLLPDEPLRDPRLKAGGV